ncbi:hypothetical protein AQUCO_00600114v1, partial [Aquilegia coerulea]
FNSMNAMEILRETIRILRYNSSVFMVIAALLICPVSAIILSNVLASCFYIYCIWVCMVVAGCLALFLVLLVAVCNVFSLLGFSSDLEIYPAMVVGFIFSIIFANVIVICNLAIVVSILEDVSGPQALLRSSVIIQGQTQVGLLIFLGSTIGMAFVEGLFEHRVKTLSYGDGSSMIWEGPLLVIMYSFVVLIDSMMSVVFNFTCRLSSLEDLEQESNILLEATTLSSGSLEIHSYFLMVVLFGISSVG